MFELADPLLGRPGKSAGLVAEKLGFDDVGGQGRAVDGDEIALGPAAEIMERARHDLLAGARLAKDQHIHIGVGKRADLFAQTLDAQRSPDEAGSHFVAAVECRAQDAVFQNQPTLFERAFDDRVEPRDGEGLLDEIIGPDAHGIDRHLHVAMAGDQDDGKGGIDGERLAQQVEPVDPRHADVADSNGIGIVPDLGQQRGAVAMDAHRQAFQLQALGEGIAKIVVIVDEMDDRLSGIGHRAPFMVIRPRSRPYRT